MRIDGDYILIHGRMPTLSLPETESPKSHDHVLALSILLKGASIDHKSKWQPQDGERVAVIITPAMDEPQHEPVNDGRGT